MSKLDKNKDTEQELSLEKEETSEALEEAVEETAETAEEPAETAEEASETAEEAEEDSEAADEESSEKEKKKAKKELSPEKLKKKQERADRRSLKSRAFRKGWFSVALVAFFIAGVIIINMIATALVDKVPALVADTTGSSSFELTDETLDYINKLGEDIKLIVLADEKTYREGGEYYLQSDTLLHQYEDNSSRISLEFTDLADDPTFTSRYPDESLAQYGIIVQGADDYRYLATTDYYDVQIDYTSYQYYIAGSKLEEAVTSAILNVTLKDKPKAAFISGITEEDYSGFKTYLSYNGFETEEISPALGNIGDDVDIIVLYAPNVDLDSAFVDKLSNFLSNGGNYGKQLLYLPGSSLSPRPNIDSLLEEWGVEVDKGYAVENDMAKISQVTYGVYLFATDYSDTSYTEKMKNPSLPVCVFYGNGVYTHPVKSLDESKAKTLLKLSEQSTIVYPPDTGDNAEPTEESSPSLSVGVIATKGDTATSDDTDTEEASESSKSSNIIVFGTNYIVTDSFLTSSMYGNASYILSLLNTVVGRDNVGVTVGTQTLESEYLDISTAVLRTLTILFAVFLPIVVLIAGIIVYIKRRNM